MPWVTVNVMEGHSFEEKKALYASVTKSISSSLNVPEEYVRIQIVEMKKENHAIAGKVLEN